MATVDCIRAVYGESLDKNETVSNRPIQFICGLGWVSSDRYLETTWHIRRPCLIIQLFYIWEKSCCENIGDL